MTDWQAVANELYIFLVGYFIGNVSNEEADKRMAKMAELRNKIIAANTSEVSGDPVLALQRAIRRTEADLDIPHINSREALQILERLDPGWELRYTEERKICGQSFMGGATCILPEGHSSPHASGE